MASYDVLLSVAEANFAGILERRHFFRREIDAPNRRQPLRFKLGRRRV